MATIESSHQKSRHEIATYLREFAEKLESHAPRQLAGTAPAEGGAEAPPEATHTRKLTIVAGNESATINPPETLTFDIEVDTDSGLLETASEHTASFTLRWDASEVADDDELTIE